MRTYVCLFVLLAGGCTTVDSPRVLNNFVTELARVDGGGSQTVRFHNPRTGWVMYRTQTASGTSQVMRYLPAGDHEVQLRDADANGFIVQTVPETIYATMNYSPRLGRFGRFDWDWLKRIGMLDACNVMNTFVPPGLFAEQWLAAGKQITTHAGVPRLRSKEPVDVEATAKYWIDHRGMNDPRFAGVLADEFYAVLGDRLDDYKEAILRVRAARPNTRFYAYIGANDWTRSGDAKAMASFVKPLVDAGAYIAYERYLQEKPTEQEARAFIESALKNEMLEFKRYAPNFAASCIYVIGMLCGPGETLSRNPGVSFRVHLDMMFHLMATDPAFVGLRGVESYLSGYADEEYLRWYAKLLRHYCIEGRTDRLTNDPYELTHIQNPDFARGLDGWTVEAAAPDSIQIKTIDHYGKMQGRYPREDDAGDRFLCTTRSEDKPNVISQTIGNLEPGRFYSVKMISGNAEQPTVHDIHRICVQIEGGESVPEEFIQDGYWVSTGEAEKQFGNAITWFNFHRYVFRATAPTAELRIYDWYTPTYRKGPVGQKMAINFIEVEPYLMPDSLLPSN